MKTPIRSLTIVLTLTFQGLLPAAEKTTSTVQANTDFAFDLYHQLAKENPGKNLFFSPYSVSSALAMTAEGARGDTAKQMGKVLRYPKPIATDNAEVPWDMNSIHAGMAALNARFNGEKDPAKSAKINAQLDALEKRFAQVETETKAASVEKDWDLRYELNAKQKKITDEINSLRAQIDQYELNVANALWAEKSYPFKEDYFEKISKFYKTGGVFPVDFMGEPEKVRLRINSWVEDMTKERIKNLLPSGTVDKLTRLVLVNAIYFKGDWSVPFKVDRTKELDFTLADGRKVKKPIMNANNLKVAKFAAFNADGSYFETPTNIERGAKAPTSPEGDGFAMLELPYKGDELSMLLIAPSNAKKLAAVESQMTAKNLSAWVAKLSQRKVHVFMPKFKVEAEYKMGDAGAPGTLQKMGMTRAFVDPRRADGAEFDGMSHAKSPTEKLYISKVLHKSFIEVNEKGTEAAAATAVVMAMPTSVQMAVPFTPTFKADRPFLYLIRDRATGSILFIGRMMNPEN